MALNKKHIITEILKILSQNLETLVETANIAKDAATAEESKAENKYDTRGLEASYLAGAQSKRAIELQEQIYRISHLKIKDYSENDPIGSTALIELDAGSNVTTFFLIPVAGGLTLKVNDTEIKTLTVEAPLGKELIGKFVGDEITIKAGDKTTCYEVINVY